ncbi:MAG: geranylgeranylglycerol-phosphate geranylgeranyltransferase [Candidatus Odinarchaeia archaeon]
MKEKIIASVKIMRPINCIIGSITTLIAVLSVNEIFNTTFLISLNSLELARFLIFAYFTYFLIAGASNIINDIFDIEVDKINRPERPLPSGALSISQAWGLTLICWIIGVTLAFLTNLVAGIIALIFVFIGFLYASRGKILGLLGNFMVAFSFAFGLLYGAIIVNFQLTGQIGIPLIIWLYFLTAFMVLQGREVIKGMEDIEGDAVRGVQTIARKYGIKTAYKIAVLFNILGIISFITSWLIGFLGFSPIPGLLYLVFFIPGVLAVSMSTIIISSNPESKKNQAKASLMDKLGSLLGLLSFLIGIF